LGAWYKVFLVQHNSFGAPFPLPTNLEIFVLACVPRFLFTIDLPKVLSVIENLYI
jgi:hypothetical protein